MIDNIRNGAITIVILWALFLGVNVEGKHYGLSFSRNGVTLDLGR